MMQLAYTLLFLAFIRIGQHCRQEVKWGGGGGQDWERSTSQDLNSSATRSCYCHRLHTLVYDGIFWDKLKINCFILQSITINHLHTYSIASYNKIARIIIIELAKVFCLLQIKVCNVTIHLRTAWFHNSLLKNVWSPYGENECEKYFRSSGRSLLCSILAKSG